MISDGHIIRNSYRIKRGLDRFKFVIRPVFSQISENNEEINFPRSHLSLKAREQRLPIRMNLHIPEYGEIKFCRIVYRNRRGRRQGIGHTLTHPFLYIWMKKYLAEILPTAQRPQKNQD